jgi:hypothetical protein
LIPHRAPAQLSSSEKKFSKKLPLKETITMKNLSLSLFIIVLGISYSATSIACEAHQNTKSKSAKSTSAVGKSNASRPKEQQRNTAFDGASKGSGKQVPQTTEYQPQAEAGVTKVDINAQESSKK